MNSCAKLICLSLLLSATAANAFDGPKWANQDDSTREWFRGLKNPNGTPCCDYADGNRVEDPDYHENDDGTYEVTVGLKTFHIDKQHIVQATNRVGYAILWGRPDYDMIYCFLPGARG